MQLSNAYHKDGSVSLCNRSAVPEVVFDARDPLCNLLAAALGRRRAEILGEVFSCVPHVQGQLQIRKQFHYKHDIFNKLFTEK